MTGYGNIMFCYGLDKKVLFTSLVHMSLDFIVQCLLLCAENVTIQ